VGPRTGLDAENFGKGGGRIVCDVDTHLIQLKNGCDVMKRLGTACLPRSFETGVFHYDRKSADNG
jgi:hypothetical protein